MVLLAPVFVRVRVSKLCPLSHFFEVLVLVFPEVSYDLQSI